MSAGLGPGGSAQYFDGAAWVACDSPFYLVTLDGDKPQFASGRLPNPTHIDMPPERHVFAETIKDTRRCPTAASAMTPLPKTANLAWMSPEDREKHIQEILANEGKQSPIVQCPQPQP